MMQEDILLSQRYKKLFQHCLSSVLIQRVEHNCKIRSQNFTRFAYHQYTK